MAPRNKEIELCVTCFLLFLIILGAGIGTYVLLRNKKYHHDRGAVINSTCDMRGAISGVNDRPLNYYYGSGYPVPRGALKLSSERYGYPFYSAKGTIPSTDYFRPYITPLENGSLHYTHSNTQRQASSADVPFYSSSVGTAVVSPGVSSTSAFAPFPQIASPYEKIGLLTSTVTSEIMNFYRRPIAPLQDLWEYTAQDKDGFVIQLKQTGLVEDGDLIENIPGKESSGPWKANIFVKNKWVVS